MVNANVEAIFESNFHIMGVSKKELINQIIANRRSVFLADFNNEKVPDEVVQQMLDNANWAPTHKLTEPWRFTVFSGPGLEVLGAFQAQLYKKVAEEDGSYKEPKYQNLLQSPTKASHVIAIGMKRDESARIREVEEIAAVACAVQNIYLTASAYDVACYWSTGGITYMEGAKSFFSLGENDKLMGFMIIGKTDKKDQKGNRKSVVEKVKWIR